MRLVILGATGSIGRSALSVWEQHRDEVLIEGLVAHREDERLWRMAQDMGARWVCLTDEPSADRLRQKTATQSGPRIVGGRPALLEELGVCDATHVLGAMTGFAGLEPTLVALERGMTVMLANKETLVAGGDLVGRVAEQAGAQLIPVDSEHSAIFQCLGMGQPARRIILTCSGGPFRGMNREQLQEVSVGEALHHPNWSMGPKVTIDSATLMNKGLEIIEAHHLFSMPYDRIDVVIHPESIIHSMVEFVDGAVLAQAGAPDMRVPIAVAMAWPGRWQLDTPLFQWPGQSLHFEEPDVETFSLLKTARQAGMLGGLYPAVLNGANEVAVEAFLAETIPFLGIQSLVQETLSRYRGSNQVATVADIIEADRWARRTALDAISTGQF